MLPALKKGERFPCPLAVVLHHGKSPWKRIPPMRDLIDTVPGVEDNILGLPIRLIDVAAMSVDNLRGHPMLCALLASLQSASTGTFIGDRLVMKARVYIFYNGVFYFFAPAYNSWLHYPIQGQDHFLVPDATNELLGSTVLEWHSLGNELLRKGIESPYNEPELLAYICETYQMKSKRSIFRLMKQCIFADNGDQRFVIQPTKHNSEDSYSVRKGDGIRRIFLPLDATAETIGAAIRRGFKRCLGLGAD